MPAGKSGPAPIRAGYCRAGAACATSGAAGSAQTTGCRTGATGDRRARSFRTGESAGENQAHFHKQAVVLGIVEGITEFLPVSSTGHLLITQHLMRIWGKTSEQNKAIDDYMVVIQFGAILAVLLIYFGRVRQVFEGIAGKNPKGLKLGCNLLVALLPAAVIGVLVEKKIDAIFDNYALWTVAMAWFLGGLLILGVTAARRKTENTVGSTVDELTWQKALAIGAVQCVAMIPGTSRSLTTILGGMWVGMSMVASVEFSFLLGLVTLTAATIFKMRHVGVMHHFLGTTSPLIGIVFAGIAAFIAVKWMIGYLNRRGLAIFGYYRLAAGIAVAVMVLAGWLVMK